MNLQTIFALGAMILLTILILNVNKTSLGTEDVMSNSSYGITAVSLASSIIEDASKKRFDNVFYEGDSVVTNLSSFTSAGVLGVETGEISTKSSTFDDFDDYNGYAAIDSSMPTAPFNISCTVKYINPATPDVPINTQSWNKKITVKVWSTFMADTIWMSSIYSYWTE